MIITRRCPILKKIAAAAAACGLIFAMCVFSGSAKNSTELLTFEITDSGAVVTSCENTSDTVIIPSQYNGVPVTAIGEFAFYSNSVTEIVIPDTVTDIGESAFFRCRSLKSITLPSGVAAIKSGLFCSCTSLSEINIPDSVSYIDTGVFYDCTKLEAINVDSGNNFYISEDGVLFSRDMKQLIAYPPAKPDAQYTIPAAVEKIAEYAFSGARFETVDLPDCVSEIGASAFYKAENLKSISLPSGISKIEAITFAGCSSLENVYFNSKVTIDPYAF